MWHTYRISDTIALSMKTKVTIFHWFEIYDHYLESFYEQFLEIFHEFI
jgi:hypothetical protein